MIFRDMSVGRVAAAVALSAVAIVVIFLSGQIVEDVGADEIVVIQSPIAGKLDWHTTPGLKWQGFGSVTKYKKRSTYTFEGATAANGKIVGGIEVRFNDGGHGTILGSIQYSMPEDIEALTKLHSSYRSQDVVQKNLIETVTNKSIYLVGTLMSSKESYAEKRNDLIHYVTDQVQNGIYRTRQKVEWIKDPITNQDKQITTAEIVTNRDGKPERQESAVLNEFGIHAYNFTINKLPYDTAVETQIMKQQEIAMNVQTSIAELKQAEQRALTVEQQGRANAAEAKWKQEVEKARAVTLAEQQKQVQITDAERNKQVALVDAERNKQAAEIAANQRLTVAKLDRDAAELTKQRDILEGEGQAEKRRLVLAADGALAQKLETYTRVSELYANAIKGSNWVPSVVMGGAGQSASSGPVDLVNLLTAKTAKELALDMSMPAAGPAQTKAR